MRQAGVFAAAGLVALEEGPARLATDHEHARVLYEAALQALPDGAAVAEPETNIVYVEGIDAAAAVAGLKQRDVLAGSMDPRTLRLVTHRDVDDEAIGRAAQALAQVLAS